MATNQPPKQTAGDLEADSAAALAGLSDLARIPFLPRQWQPADLNSAYRVQGRVRALSGSAIAGYKVGMTNQAVQKANGLAEPIAGWLSPASVLRTGTVIRDATRRLRLVESEVIFQMASDLPPGGARYSRDAVSRAVAAAYAGLEICDSRFVDLDAQPAVNVIADNSNASLLVVGSQLPALVGPLDVTLSCGSATPVSGSTAAVLGDPLLSLCWLANWLNDRGEALLAGQYVASGTCTGISVAGPNDHCAARFGTDAAVECYFAP